MKRNTSALLIVCLFAATVAQAQSKSSAVQQILTLLHEQNLAANAHDTDRLLTTYLHDDSLIFVSNGQLIQGFNSLHEQQLKWWNNGKSDVIYTELAPAEVISLGSQTVLATQQLASHRTMPDGMPSEGKLA